MGGGGGGGGHRDYQPTPSLASRTDRQSRDEAGAVGTGVECLEQQYSYGLGDGATTHKYMQEHCHDNVCLMTGPCTPIIP